MTSKLGPIAAALAFCGWALCGCVADRPKGGSQVHATPASATPGRVAVMVSDRFEDTDGNGYRDMATATVYVMADEADYPLPMKAIGAFDFVLQGRTGERLAEWKFDEKKTAEAAYVLAPGPGFIFELSLLAAGGDRLKATEADLLCTFTPKGGTAVKSRAPVRVVVGPTGRAQADR